MKSISLLLLAMSLAAALLPAQEAPAVAVLAPQRDAIWVGRLPVRIDVRGVAADSLHAVDVYLDGRLIRELKGAPYSFEHDFGLVPQNSTLRAVLRVGGQVLAAAEIRSLAIDDAQEVDVTQVLVPVVVTDAQGNYVPDLRREDFILLEDGRPQPISNFSRSGKSRSHLALLVDVSSSMKDRIGEVKEAAREFLKQVLNPRDKAIVVFFNHEVFEQTDFSSDLDELSNSIATAFPFGATALYDAVGHCLKLLSGKPGLNIIVIFSDGEDNSSYLDPYTLIKKAERSNAVIYAIGRQSASYDEEYQTILRNLSASSGGMLFFIEDGSQVQNVYQRIRQDIKAEYVLEFSPDKGRRGKRFRRITVKVKGRKKYTVRTIKGFYY